MNRSTRLVIGAVASVLALLPLGARAQESAAQVFSIDVVSAAFIGSGYTVEEPMHWQWTNPPVTTLRVRGLSTGDDRLLMVLMYADVASADAERRSVRGEHPVPGYGPAVWTGNVAMVQSTQTELDKHYAALAEAQLGIPDMLVGRVVGFASNEQPVDADFVAVLRETLGVDL
jgi:hypothetical protein